MTQYILKNTLIALVGITFFSACTTTSQNPNNATQTAAAVGAIAGATIGYNNSGKYSKGGAAIAGGALGAAIGAGVGNVIDNNTQPPKNTGGWQ